MFIDRTLASDMRIAQVRWIQRLKLPPSLCPGITWWDEKIAENPQLTLAGLLEHVKKDFAEDRMESTWFLDLFRGQGVQLRTYPEFREELMKRLKPKHAFHLLRDRDDLTDNEKAILRKLVCVYAETRMVHPKLMEKLK